MHYIIHAHTITLCFLSHFVSWIIIYFIFLFSDFVFYLFILNIFWDYDDLSRLLD